VFAGVEETGLKVPTGSVGIVNDYWVTDKPDNMVSILLIS
jgi:hypothetical protein